MPSYSVGLRGESNYQAAIARSREGEIAHLIEEPDNRYDPRAVQVLNAAGDLIGYLPRDGWLTDMLLDQGIRPVCTIASIQRPAGSSKPWGVVILVEK